MKWLTAIALGTAAFTAFGCQKANEGQWAKKDMNRGMLFQRQIEHAEEAILVQQTLFPYHFQENGADLSSLGERDLEVLGRHYRNYPGTLNVRQGDADDDLYDERVRIVLNTLADMGVDTASVTVADGMAGGSGVHSARALILDERTAEPVQSSWGAGSDWR